MNLDSKNIFWKDRYYFPQLVDIVFSNLALFVVSVLLFSFFVIRGFIAIGSIFKGIISGSLTLITVVAGLLLSLLLFDLLLFCIWVFLIVIRTISYFCLSKHLILYEEEILLGKDRIIFPDKLDSFLFTSSGNSFLRKILFFRATLNYPFFKIKNKTSTYIKFNEINQISIIRDSVFRTILRKWWSPKENVYYLKIITTNGDIYKKEIKDIYAFIKKDCLNFLSSKVQSSIKIPPEIQNVKFLKFENVTGMITAIIILSILIFFILVYIRIYGGINLIPFIK